MSSDHLLAWRTLVHAAPLPVNAQYSLLRSALEGIATCRWVLAPNVGDLDQDRDERIRRGVALQLRDHNERHGFEVTWEKATNAKISRPPGGKPALERREELLAEKTKHRIGSVTVPEPTSLFRRFAVVTPGFPPDGTWLYQILSAHAHNRQWTLLTSSLGERVNLPGIPGTAAVAVRTSDELAVAATLIAVDGLTAALEQIETYAGRPR